MLRWLIPVLVLAGIAGAILFFPSPEESAQLIQEAIPVAQIDPIPVARVGQQPTQPLVQFLNDASLAVVLRYPETITSLGIGSMIGVRDDTLMPLSRAYELETIALLESLLEQLAQYDLSQANSDDALSAQVYGWYLTDLLESHRYADHDYLITSFINSYPEQLERHLTRSHPMSSPANVEDYVSRLSQIAVRFDELVDRLNASESIGAIPPAFILQLAADAIREKGMLPAEEASYHAKLAESLPFIPGMSDAREDEMMATADEVLRTSVLPAYLELAEAVSALAERAGPAIGTWRHDNGDDYYAHQLRKYTTTDLSASEIHATGLDEVERIQAEVFEVADGLGLNPQEGLQALFEQLTHDYGIVTAQQTVAACDELITEITPLVRPAFLDWPDADIVVVEGGTSAFFTPGTFDGSRPGMFYAPAGRDEPLFSLATLTYHEAVPGHGLQTAFAYAADIPVYRAGLGFTAYAEGWALYAERLAWEMGAYESNPVGNLGRLQAELFRAVRLVVDTGIHAQKWTAEDAVTYMMQNTGLDEPFVRQEVARYIVMPGQATAYKIGMLEMVRLRSHAQQELGERFDLPSFHEAILGEGDVPLLILSELVDAYIERAR